MKNLLTLALVAVAAFNAQAIEVTFKIDMSEVTESFTTPEVNGTFNNWCGSCAPMADEDGDGVWELVIDLVPGNYEYKFSADTWNIQETLVSGSECTITAGQFVNRVLTVASTPIELPVVCWGSCSACGEGPTTTNVVFRVNMNDATEAFTTPEVNGTFNNWCGGCAPMSDVDGDGIWELTISILGETAEFKFAADTWAVQESLTEGDPCTITTDGFTNRILQLEGGNLELPIVCWGSCINCSTGIAEGDAFGAAVTVYPNPASVTAQFVNLPEGQKTIDVYALTGALIATVSTANTALTLDVSRFPAGMYLTQISNAHGATNRYLIIE